VVSVERPSWDSYYLGIARAVATRGECTRRQVGAVIVSGHTIVSTGYNGAPPGELSCLDGKCPRAASQAVPGVGYAASGCVVIHAEVNALLRAGIGRAEGATLYCTDEPCESCAPLIRAAGIAHVVFPRIRDERAEDVMPVRTTDPITSWLGDQDVQGRRVPQRMRLLGVYGGAFPEGLTNAQAGEVAGMAPHSCYWKRCSELLESGFIEEVVDGSGSVVNRRNEQTGSVQRVCRITDSGWTELRSFTGR